MAMLRAFVFSLYVAALTCNVMGREIENKYVDPVTYWNLVLPLTPIPESLRERISPLSSHNISQFSINNIGKELCSKGKLSCQKSQKSEYAKSINEPDPDDPDVAYIPEEELQEGSNITLRLPKTNYPSPASFLPRPVADAIAFSSDKISVVLEKLNIPADSDMAAAMRYTVNNCNIKGKGEGAGTNCCQDSLESMVDYVTDKLGTRSVKVVQPQDSPANAKVQEYTVTSSAPLTSGKGVVCKSEEYAYAVYLCLELGEQSKAVQLSLRGVDGTIVNAVGLCDRHENNNGDVNVKAGLCRFVGSGHLLWLTNSN